MSYTLSLVILANSYKLQARCVAGKQLNGGVPGQWVRPVNTAHHGGAVSERDIQGGDGKGTHLRDIVNISFKGKSSHTYQPENQDIDTAFYWDKVGVADQAMLQACVDRVRGNLWVNNSSSYSGVYDRMSEEDLFNVNDSLKFVLVRDLSISVINGYEGKRQVRGSFTLSEIPYNLVITDPDAHTHYLSRGEGSYSIGNSYLCISIGEVFNGFAYKLIAGIIGTGL